MISNLTTYHNGDMDPGLLSPLNLAFVGDTVFDLMVKERLISRGNRPVGKLHRECAEIVCAAGQARAAKIIESLIDEKETEIFKRGRNAKVGHKPKNANEADYHAATGFEALIGWLYLSGNFERLKELIELILSEFENEKEKNNGRR